MIKALTAATLGLAAILGGSTPTLADYMVYTNRASFEAAITNEQTETFNELGPTLQMVGTTGLSQGANGLVQPISVTGSNNFLLTTSSTALAGYYPSYGTYLVGPTSTSPTSPDGITVNLAGSTSNAAGADVANFASKSMVSFVATTSLGETLTGSVLVDGSTPGSPLGFLGVTLSTPNDYVTSLAFASPAGANQPIVLDNFSFGIISPSVVPEPASMALLFTGFLAFGAGALRHRLRSNAS